MAYSDDKRYAVRNSYVFERLPLSAASEKHDIPYNTVRGWKKKSRINGDDWDKARSASRLAQKGLGDFTDVVLEEFALLFKTTINDLKEKDSADPIKRSEAISRLADAYTKTVKAAGLVNPRISQLGTALETLKLFSKFISDQFPEQIETFVTILEQFAPVISQEFSA